MQKGTVKHKRAYPTTAKVFQRQCSVKRAIFYSEDKTGAYGLGIGNKPCL